MIPDYLRRSPIAYLKDILEVDESTSDLALFGDAKGIERLTDLRKLRRIWLIGANQKQFDKIVSSVNLTVFKGYNLRVPDLGCLERFTEIEELSLNWNTKAHDIESIGKLLTLRIFQIQDFTQVHDLTPIARLSNLEALDISGGIWNTFKVDTLEPLEHLANLRYLCLTNIRVHDESLTPISRLSLLKKLDISNQFPTEEYAKLSVWLPKVECEYFKPYIDLKQKIGNNDVMVVGKRKPFLNKGTDSRRLKKYEQEFNRLREKYQTQKY